MADAKDRTLPSTEESLFEYGAQGRRELVPSSLHTSFAAPRPCSELYGSFSLSPAKGLQQGQLE